MGLYAFFFFFSSRRRHTRFDCVWSSDVCSSDLDGSYLAGEPYKQKDDEGKSMDVSSEESVPNSKIDVYLQRLESKGYYWHFVTKEQLTHLNENPSESETLFLSKITERLLVWAGMITSGLPEPVKCFWI